MAYGVNALDGRRVWKGGARLSEVCITPERRRYRAGKWVSRTSTVDTFHTASQIVTVAFVRVVAALCATRARTDAADQMALATASPP